MLSGAHLKMSLQMKKSLKKASVSAIKQIEHDPENLHFITDGIKMTSDNIFLVPILWYNCFSPSNVWPIYI